MPVETVSKDTRLYYSTEEISGEVGRLVRIDITAPRYDLAQSWCGQSIAFTRALEEVVFETVDYLDSMVASDLSYFLNKKLPVAWTVELPTGITWAFRGYVSDIEREVSSIQSKHTVKIQVCGPVNLYSYAEPAVDKSPVFTKAASKEQADTLARMLAQILVNEPATPTHHPAYVPTYRPNTMDAPEEISEYDEYDDEYDEEY